MYYKVSRSKVKVTAWKRHLIAKRLLSFRKLVAESNGDVRFLIESWEIAVCAHVQYRFNQKQPRMTGMTSGGLKLQCVHNFHVFYINFKWVVEILAAQCFEIWPLLSYCLYIYLSVFSLHSWSTHKQLVISKYTSHYTPYAVEECLLVSWQKCSP